MKTKTEAAKVLLEAGWSWDEVREVLEEDKVIPNRDTYSLIGYGTYGETYSVPVYGTVESGKYYIDGSYRPISG